MSVIGSNILAGASGQGGDYTIEESLRFNASQSSYLSWTPASAGNRKTWTWSGWVKRGTFGQNQLFSAGAGTGGSPECYIDFEDNINFQIFDGTSNLAIVRSTAVYRDPSAWYHVVVAVDTTQATASNRVKIYINGQQITAFAFGTYPAQNLDTQINAATSHRISSSTRVNGYYFDGYLTEVNFIDGQALDASSFGETDATTGVWKPVGYTGTYGTNGFYLPMKLDNTTEGFNTVTWVGNNSGQTINGVGFSPDLVWLKTRNVVGNHVLFDSVRGPLKELYSNATNSESAETNGLDEFTTDGFHIKSVRWNDPATNYVAWCWDAGNTTVSNTDGSITSSVRANPTYGFSVVTYTIDAQTTPSIGHGLGSAPAVIINKARNQAYGWDVYHKNMAANPENNRLILNSTSAVAASAAFGYTAPTSSLFYTTGGGSYYGSGDTVVAYCFSEVSGYSKFGSYTGTGASGNAVTTGFKPAFVMVKRTDGVGNWFMFDSTRDAGSTGGNTLWANYSNAEDNGGSPLYPIEYTDTGFVIQNGSDPNASGGTYIYMAFKDTREYAFWLDDSGNNNDWQPNGGITTSSTVTDTPTPYLGGGNYAVLNPLDNGGVTLSNTNLTITGSGNAFKIVRNTFGMSSGKWYCEFVITTESAPSRIDFGLLGYPATLSGFLGDTANGYAVFESSGNITKYNNSTSATLVAGGSLDPSDVQMLAYDADAGKLWFGKNGSWFASGDPAAGTNPVFSSVSGQTYFVAVQAYNSSDVGQVNFGQRPFAYTPPTGFLPLHTGNLPDSTIVDGSKHFNAVLYTGNTSGASVTGIGFQPDFVWSKNRSVANNHELIDVVRGGSSALFSNLTNAEATQQRISSFDSDGWTYTTNSNSALANPYVAWNWKANGTGVTNTDGSITSTVSANPTAGFSIVTYTGTGSAATVGHGLGVTPSLVIIKNRTTARSWPVRHSALIAANNLYLDSTSASTAISGTQYGGVGTLTSSTFGFVSGSVNISNVNSSANDYVAYLFSEVAGFSKFGSYTGNGSADGPFVFTGFRPAFVLRKCSGATGDWFLIDATRSPHNVSLLRLNANTSDAESSGANSDIDILSNGFKIRAASTAGVNQSGQPHIYMAFAEVPFSKALAR